MKPQPHVTELSPSIETQRGQLQGLVSVGCNHDGQSYQDRMGVARV